MMGRAAVVLACLLSCSCVPWTVQPIGDAGPDRPFDAEAYVDSIWRSKVLPAAAQAVEVADFLKAPRTCLVKGQGKIVALDIGSRTGLIMVDLPPYDGRADILVQIGPVIRGTALRDALPFIQFSQFVNQMQYAAVGNALNGRVVKNAIPKALTVGLEVSFSGAAAAPEAGRLPEVVPVTLEVGHATRRRLPNG